MVPVKGRMSPFFDDSWCFCHKKMLYFVNMGIFIDKTEKRRSNRWKSSKGVYYDRSRKKWLAEITVHYKKIHLGRYKKKADAVAMRQAFEDGLNRCKNLLENLEEKI